MLELVGDFFGRKKECVVAGISGGEPPWAHEAGGAPRGVGVPPPSWIGCGPPGLDYFTSIFYIFQKYSPLIFRSF